MFWQKLFKKKKDEGLQKEKDRRKEPRQEEENEITIEPQNPEALGIEKRPYQARTRNASPGGLKIHTDLKFPVGTVLDIKLHSTKTGKVIQAAGRVRWISSLAEGRAYEIGLEFVDTPVNTIMDLLDHIYKG